MEGAFSRASKIYLTSLNLVIGFGIFIVLSLALMPLISSYINVGGGFIRFSSLYLDLTPAQALIFVGISILSLLLLSIFLSAIISIVKLRETLDHVGFAKVAALFKKYVLRVFMFLLFLSILSIAVGTILDFAGVHRLLTHVIIFVLWLPFIFTPQILVLEDFGINESIIDSIKFIKNSPMSLILYLVFGLILLLIFTIIETGLGRYFVWEHKIVSIIFISMVVLPYLQMFATELYLKRYPISHV